MRRKCFFFNDFLRDFFFLSLSLQGIRRLRSFSVTQGRCQLEVKLIGGGGDLSHGREGGEHDRGHIESIGHWSGCDEEVREHPAVIVDDARRGVVGLRVELDRGRVKPGGLRDRRHGNLEDVPEPRGKGFRDAENRLRSCAARGRAERVAEVLARLVVQEIRGDLGGRTHAEGPIDENVLPGAEAELETEIEGVLLWESIEIVLDLYVLGGHLPGLYGSGETQGEY